MAKCDGEMCRSKTNSFPRGLAEHAELDAHAGVISRDSCGIVHA